MKEDNARPVHRKANSYPCYAAACQTDFACPRTRQEIAACTRTMCTMVEETIIGYEPFFDVRLFVFPEYAHGGPVYDTVEEIREKIAVPVPNEHTEQYERTAAKYRCYIQSGFMFFEAATKGSSDCVFGREMVSYLYAAATGAKEKI